MGNALNEIVEEIHRRANKGHAYCDFTVTITHAQYVALCEEEEAEAANSSPLATPAADVGGLTRYMPDVYLMGEMIEKPYGAYVKYSDVAALLATKAAQPVHADISDLITPDGGLYHLGWYVSWSKGDERAVLDGEFTAAGLYAIASHMIGLAASPAPSAKQEPTDQSACTAALHNASQKEGE
jgi:hypothetical protein